MHNTLSWLLSLAASCFSSNSLALIVCRSSTHASLQERRKSKCLSSDPQLLHLPERAKATNRILDSLCRVTAIKHFVYGHKSLQRTSGLVIGPAPYKHSVCWRMLMMKGCEMWNRSYFRVPANHCNNLHSLSCHNFAPWFAQMKKRIYIFMEANGFGNMLQTLNAYIWSILCFLKQKWNTDQGLIQIV